ncbi:MAG: hypothetical protein K0R76_1488 [Alphaproteobacteria bacterium]|jgi:ABC-type multidrug transport system fused ATPase/permease subunit|nr:hypothetical protein [Alphaproteobacteria bacterium]
MRVLKFLIEMSKPYRFFIWGIILAMTFVAIDANVKPYLIKTIIDMIGSTHYRYIWRVVFIYAIMQFSLVLAWSLYDYCSAKIYPAMTAHITKFML